MNTKQFKGLPKSAVTATASEAISASKTTSTTKAPEAKAAAKAETSTKTKSNELVIHIVLILLPRYCLSRLKVVNIQHLNFIMKIIHFSFPPKFKLKVRSSKLKR